MRRKADFCLTVEQAFVYTMRRNFFFTAQVKLYVDMTESKKVLRKGKNVKLGKR
jgi:hypothetical protein